MKRTTAICLSTFVTVVLVIIVLAAGQPRGTASRSVSDD
jgi:hypothetical protein